MDGEIWRIVPSLPSVMASSEGRVMVLPYQATMPNGAFRQYGGQPHFGVWSKADGRFLLILKGRSYKVARLVCEAFHGVPPSDATVCMHMDENSANNRASNLAWGTQAQNLNAPAFLEYCRGRVGEESPTIKARMKLSTKPNPNQGTGEPPRTAVSA
jgi:hypothetical protein